MTGHNADWWRDYLRETRELAGHEDADEQHRRDVSGRPSAVDPPERYVDARELAELMGVSPVHGQTDGRRRHAVRDLGHEPHPPLPSLAGDGMGARPV